MASNDASSLVIIDTSAFIEANQKPVSVLGRHVQSLIETGLAAITPMIRWELGRGKTAKKEHFQLMDYLNCLEILDWQIDWGEFEVFDSKIRDSGFIVPFTDLWIAKTAIIWKALLLHQDKHFSYIATCSELKIWNPS